MRVRMLFALLLVLVVSFAASAQEETTTFTVTVENVAGNGLYENSGVAAIPVDAEEAGPALPGSAYEFTVTAEPGNYLSFVTMLAQSNDLFFAPDENGIALFDDMGSPISGDVTDQVLLWDAGTEQNQPIGEGDEQAPRQAGPNTGADEMGVVRPVSDLDDGLIYPAASDIISVTIEGSEDGNFTIRIENISGDYMIPGPITPVVWIVNHRDMMAPHGVFFTTGEPVYGRGLEVLAEDGNVSELAAVIVGTEFTTPITPVVWVVHDTMMDGGVFFDAGQPDRGEGLESVAEDGDPSALSETISMYPVSGVAAVPSGAEEAGPALPGSDYTFTFEAAPGQALSFVTMLAQSNDLFFAPDENGIALFDDMGSPISGNVTRYVPLWDAGTEVNEELGMGPNQAPRQVGPNTGDDEMGVVGLDNSVPAASIIRVTITAGDDMMMGG